MKKYIILLTICIIIIASLCLPVIAHGQQSERYMYNEITDEYVKEGEFYDPYIDKDGDGIYENSKGKQLDSSKLKNFTQERLDKQSLDTGSNGAGFIVFLIIGDAIIITSIIIAIIKKVNKIGKDHFVQIEKHQWDLHWCFSINYPWFSLNISFPKYNVLNLSNPSCSAGISNPYELSSSISFRLCQPTGKS